MYFHEILKSSLLEIFPDFNANESEAVILCTACTDAINQRPVLQCGLCSRAIHARCGKTYKGTENVCALCTRDDASLLVQQADKSDSEVRSIYLYVRIHM